MAFNFNESEVSDWDKMPHHLQTLYKLLHEDGIIETPDIVVEAPFILSPNLIEPAISKKFRTE